MSLEDLRARIDEIDVRLVELLNERAATALKIGDEKRRQRAVIHDPAREMEIMNRLANLNGGPLTDEGLRRIYRAIIDVCTAMQEPGGTRGGGS